MALSIIAVLLLLAAGCGSSNPVPDGAELAYVGPFELELHAELSPEAEVPAILKHGDPVHIVDHRRRFAKVLTDTGVEGWVDGLMLLAPHEMERTRQLAAIAKGLPAQGQAHVFDVLNVHTAPNRQAPSLFQLTENMTVDVVSHRVAPREVYQPPATDALVFPLPGYRLSPDYAAPPNEADDWTLVRTGDGRAGWALTRMLAMSIPDDVARYAGGQLITSYFPLGEVTDEGRHHQHWLWTTRSSRLASNEFDSFRVFVWSTARHRYETAAMERGLVGYYPVEVNLDPGKDAEGSQATFALILRNPDGSLERRRYGFSGYRVRALAREPWQPPPEPPIPDAEPLPAPREDPGWVASMTEIVQSWFR